MVTFHDEYDVTAREKATLKEIDARRLRLRNEYLKKYLNPFKPPGHLADIPVQRLMSARLARVNLFKPNVLNWCAHIFYIFGPIFFLTLIVKKERDIKEYQYRNGQVPYATRADKFF